MSIEHILYRGTSKATGGREGKATSSDGILDVKLTTPKELGGPGGAGTNPEQLFAAGHAACFLGAIKFVASQMKVAIPADASIESTVGIGKVPTGFAIEEELKISLPGIARDVAEEIVKKAEVVCPYSHATKGNIDVKLTIL